MKKILVIISLVVLSIGVSSNIFAEPSSAPEYEQCTHFRNVSASISTVHDGVIHAIIKNHNDNAQMVDWEIKAYDKKGNYVTIGRGQVKVNGNDTEYGYNIPVEGYSGWGITIHNCTQL